MPGRLGPDGRDDEPGKFFQGMSHDEMQNRSEDFSFLPYSPSSVAEHAETLMYISQEQGGEVRRTRCEAF